MKIRTKDITEEGLELNVVEESWLKRLVQDTIQTAAPCEIAELHARLVRMGSDFNMEGHLNYAVELACDRCLALYKITGNLPIHMILLPKSGQEENENIYYFADDLIDINEILREQLLLSQPMVKLCKDDCKGLCQRCGKNLNEGECNHR